MAMVWDFHMGGSDFPLQIVARGARTILSGETCKP